MELSKRQLYSALYLSSIHRYFQLISNDDIKIIGFITKYYNFPRTIEQATLSSPNEYFQLVVKRRTSLKLLVSRSIIFAEDFIEQQFQYRQLQAGSTKLREHLQSFGLGSNCSQPTLLTRDNQFSIYNTAFILELAYKEFRLTNCSTLYKPSYYSNQVFLRG